MLGPDSTKLVPVPVVAAPAMPNAPLITPLKVAATFDPLFPKVVLPARVMLPEMVPPSRRMAPRFSVLPVPVTVNLLAKVGVVAKKVAPLAMTMVEAAAGTVPAKNILPPVVVLTLSVPVKPLQFPL